MLCAKQKATREEPVSPAGGRRAMLAEPPCAQGRRRLSTGPRGPARRGLLRISLSLSPPSVSLKKIKLKKESFPSLPCLLWAPVLAPALRKANAPSEGF